MFELSKTLEDVRKVSLQLEYNNLCSTRIANAYKLNMHKLVSYENLKTSVFINLLKFE